jgi:hypothetical protein
MQLGLVCKCGLPTEVISTRKGKNVVRRLRVCLKGHRTPTEEVALGPVHRRAKIEKPVLKDLKSGMSVKDCADKYGVSRATISRIKALQRVTRDYSDERKPRRTESKKVVPPKRVYRPLVNRRYSAPSPVKTHWFPNPTESEP